jgi:hypothetical protein
MLLTVAFFLSPKTPTIPHTASDHAGHIIGHASCVVALWTTPARI